MRENSKNSWKCCVCNQDILGVTLELDFGNKQASGCGRVIGGINLRFWKASVFTFELENNLTTKTYTTN